MGQIFSYPEHYCLNLDVQVWRLALLQRQHLDRLLQVEGECVEPKHRQRVHGDLNRVDVREELGRGDWKLMFFFKHKVIILVLNE